MRYYKVKKDYDQHGRKDGSILVKNELYTETEKARYGIPDKAVDAVEIKKSETYWCFGARFANK